MTTYRSRGHSRRTWRRELGYQLQRAAGTALVVAGLLLASAHLSA